MPIQLEMTETLRSSILSVLGDESKLTSAYPDGDKALLLTQIEDETSTINLAALEALEKCLLKSQKPSSLRDLIKGSRLVFHANGSRESNILDDPNQVRRKNALKLRAQQREYDRMVENVDPKQKYGLAVRNGAAVSLKRASYGAHIIVGMFLGFGAGFMLSKSVYDGGTTVQYIGGIIGMVGTLLLEVTLYMIREEKVRRIKERNDPARKPPPVI